MSEPSAVPEETDITDELREAAEAFETAEFHDDMPIREVPNLLRRAAEQIERLRGRRADQLAESASPSRA